jgi:hypothetical protein
MTNTVKIAPLDQALTFARLLPAKGGQILAVTAYDQDVVAGIDLTALKSDPSEDPIDLVNRLGYEALLAVITAAKTPITVAACELDRPVDLTSEHIAVGTNYPEHAKESAVQIRPFLFPKYVTTTGPRADIPTTDGLLDYEVELCLVVLKPLGLDAPAQGGLILGNDRLALLNRIAEADVAEADAIGHLDRTLDRPRLRVVQIEFNGVCRRLVSVQALGRQAVEFVDLELERRAVA